jgi:hypothetical protein
MIEVVVLYFLGKQTAQTAESKGYSGTTFALLLILFWVVGEFGGGFFAVRVLGRADEKMLVGHLLGGAVGRMLIGYVCALLGAGIGVALSFLVLTVLPGGSEEDRALLRRKYRRRYYHDDPDSGGGSRHKEAAMSTGVTWTLLSTGGLFVTGIVGVLLFLGLVGGGGGAGKGAVSANPQIVQMPGVLAYWSFDAIEDGKVIDHSGRNNHATLFGGRLAPGARGQALWLDDQPAHYLDFSTSPDFNFGHRAEFTFACWFTSNQVSASILSMHDTKGPICPQVELLLREGRLIVIISDDLDIRGKNGFVWGKQKNDGGWHHVAFTRKGQTVELFVDGVSQGQDTTAGTGGSITTDLRAVGCERGWILGGDLRWGNPSFKGGIDEVCFFSRALTQAELQSLMH